MKLIHRLITVVLLGLLVLATFAIGCRDDRRVVDHGPMMPVGRALGPVAPGSYVNHIGNPMVGYWGQGGDWRWHDRSGVYANETWNYLAAAGLAGGASMYFTRRYFDRKYGGSWQRSPYVIDHYTDYRGNTISKAQYQTRRNTKVYVDRKGKEISKAEYTRRRDQSKRDRAKTKTATRTTATRTTKAKSTATPYTDHKAGKTATAKPYSSSKTSTKKPYTSTRTTSRTKSKSYAPRKKRRR